MDRLIINPTSDQPWEAPLRPGRNTLGRAADCDVVLDHSSVASQHAEIEVTGAGVVLRDLASERGSWFQGNRVDELELEPGLEFSVGDVAVRFEGEQRSREPAPSAVPVAAPARRICRHHPREVARWHCSHCGRDFCEACVNVHGGGHVSNHFCRACGDECEALPAPAGFVAGAPEAETDFWTLLAQALAYPLRGNGPILLAAGTVFLILVEIVMSAAGGAVLIGLAAVMIVTVFAGGYTFNYCKRIIESTANGDDDPPDWPDFSDLTEDAIQPFLQLLALLALVFGPAFCMPFVQSVPDSVRGWLTLLLTVLGGLLAPIGLLALTIYDRILALNPALLVPSMLRCPLHYFVSALVFLAAIGAYGGVGSLLRWLVPVPFVPGIVAAGLGLYFLIVAMRVLGVFYRANREQLGWLKR
jgi:hypothetical protein